MIELIPAIDIFEGQVVRLQQGDYQRKKVYAANPLDLALKFQDEGAKRMHVVDLEGAKSSRVINLKVLEKLASCTALRIDFGGGVKSDEDFRHVLDAGADYINLGSIAVKDRDKTGEWITQYGPEKIILGADVRNEKIAVQGWLETTETTIWDFLDHYTVLGINQVISTDISRDGMMKGPGFELYGKLKSRYPELGVIASGGVSSNSDVIRLQEMGVEGAILGKALLEGEIQLQHLTSLLSNAD